MTYDFRKIKMKIPEFGSLEMIRTNESHYGKTKIVQITQNIPSLNPVKKVQGVTSNSIATSVEKSGTKPDFQNYLLEALNKVNSQQNDVSKIEEQIITDPESVDIHDVTIAMSKARMSLNLAQTVIDRLVNSWNEISTTR